MTCTAPGCRGLGCPNEVEFTIPSPLCLWHWCLWFNYDDVTLANADYVRIWLEDFLIAPNDDRERFAVSGVIDSND